MNPSIPISWGELIDKITILEIKAKRLTSESARAHVRHELEQLGDIATEAETRPGVAELKSSLRRVNEKLWGIEDDIRAKEAAKKFDAGFVELARAVYQNNDERGRIKQAINKLLHSGLVEEKEYTRY